ncbi:MAG: ParB/RepB/Spo0J family partition protein [Chloroflexi bacterium]|nr:ParB/RepB/Spo0J family partition protein [Chloroflexota bacterium]
MAGRRSGLGRGLDALIGPAAGPVQRGAAGAAAAEAAEPGETGTIVVEIGRIEPNPLQPRRHIEEKELDELAESIKEHGLLQPLVVTRQPAAAGAVDAPAASGSRPRYQLIAGERRLRAARRAGLVRVPVVVREAAGRELLELALVENVQRADLNPLEEAAAYQQLAGEFGMTQEEIGRRVGKSRFSVSNAMRLLQLPASVQQAVLDGQLSEGHARALLGVPGTARQRSLAEQVLERGLTVRQTEALVRRALERPSAPGRPGRPRKTGLGEDVLELQERFQRALGTKVELIPAARGGRLVIHYYSDEQLNDIYERLAADEP